MTDIAMRAEQAAVTTYAADNMDRLERWVRQALAVRQIAESVCATSFAPAAYRGKPDEATAAILAGAELGFDPMASLRAFDSIQGVPAPKAITLRAVVQGKGHEIEIVESTAERAVVRGRRFGRGEWQTSVWDHARAQTMPQYKSNPQYKQNPTAMFVARATAEMCRWIASDAVMGMPYAAEEIAGDPAFAPVPAPPAVRRLTPADLDGPPAIEAAPDEPRTEAQKRRMFKLWADLGFGTDADRATRLDLTSKFVGREVESSNDLTADEAAIVIARQEARKVELDAQAAEVSGAGGASDA